MSRDKDLVFLAKDMMITMKISKTRMEEYDIVTEEAKKIFIDRNKMYGDAFIFLGLIGNVATLVGDIFRIKTMVYDHKDHGRSYKLQIRDKLLDIINQAVICILVLSEDNYEGKN